MNCANHPQTPAAAYCRTCGKGLCSNCTRQVMGVIYCENCLADRMGGSVPAAQFQPAPGYQPGPMPQVTSGGPNPALAGILAGFFPFGVGAVYCGQYAKGLAHLIAFTLLVIGASSGSDVEGTIFGLAPTFFYVYQIIDSVRSARALQMGQPAPDPF